MRKLKKITTDKDLNEILKTRKKNNFSVLYYSLWCQSSSKILKLAEEWEKREGNEIVYLVNSWDLPQSFASFSITVAPSLVHLINGKVRVDIEFPKLYDFFTTLHRAKP